MIKIPTQQLSGDFICCLLTKHYGRYLQHDQLAWILLYIVTEIQHWSYGMKAAQVKVYGVVQGGGFRPFVYRLAREHDLRGWVCNTSGGVDIDVEGQAAGLKGFLDDLGKKAPPVIRIERTEVTYHKPNTFDAFRILESRPEPDVYQLLPPDVSTCDACLKELRDPKNRRFRYPFTNCTHCGPRFSIIRDIPYDRPQTTMSAFTMCADCREEYDDPADRRFHAQPNACPECGPRLWLADPRGRELPCSDVISSSVELLRSGKILAIRGLCGFQLACDAGNGAVVRLLRKRKHRPAKPFAIMMTDLETIEMHCTVSEGEAALLTSRQSPIVLLRRRTGRFGVCPSVAPNLEYLGVMLPYTPLHHLLTAESNLPLVLTSGNLSGEPIAKDNEEALRRLGDVADYFLLHNRDIHVRYDDSVCMVSEGIPRTVRRARGFVPHPVSLPYTSRQVLACGAEEKNTFCLTRDRYAFVGPHIGDLSDEQTFEHYESCIDLFRRMFRIDPRMVACDMHPDYASTKYAERVSRWQGLPLIPVQHHHAHIVSCMVENGEAGPVIGVAFDGTGYGTDGAIWGGEFLLADFKGFRRAGHLEYVPMPGGEAAIRKPYRMALAYMFSLLEENIDLKGLPLEKYTGEADLIRRQLARCVNAPLTSSAGRLFDGVSALLGIREEIDYDSQAAIELESAAMGECGRPAPYPFSFSEESGTCIIQTGPLIDAVIRDIRAGVSDSRIAMAFHVTMADMIAALCRRIYEDTGVRHVALSGGVFQNRLLLGLARAALEKEGFEVFLQAQVPCNDGGISLGQAVVADHVFSDSCKN